MTPETVRLHDVYSMMVNLVAPMYVMFWMLVVVCAAVMVQIALKIFSTWRELSTLHRIEQFLTMAERHAQVTDSKNERAAGVLEEVKDHAKAAAVLAVRAVTEVRAAVAEVPKKVVEEIQQSDGSISVERPIQGPPAPPASK